MTGSIPYGRQSISDEDIAAVVQVLGSDFLTQGEVVPAFEQAVAAHCGASHAVASCNATASLHLACLALGVGPGDWVWTSPITFLASANCALYCGASVDFVDIDPETFNLCAERLAEKLAHAAAAGRLPKVVIPVHLCGQSCDMERIQALGRQYGFAIIEDASHAIGGSYRERPVGACGFSDITVFSFHPVKIITTGEGGMATTNDQRLAERMRLLRSHGMTRDPALLTRAPDGPWYYEQVALGFNYRMTEIQAALGLSQLKRLEAFVDARHALAARYDTLLADLPVRAQRRQDFARSALHLYVIRLGTHPMRRTHREVFESLRADGIEANLHYIPVYLQPYYRQFGFQPGYCPAAEAYYSQAITLPLYPRLEETQQLRVVDALYKALGV